MTDKKVNVLSQLLCVFKSRKMPCGDIVATADKVVEDYICTRSRLIHRKYKKNNNGLWALTAAFAFSLGVVLIFINIV